MCSSQPVDQGTNDETWPQQTPTCGTTRVIVPSYPPSLAGGHRSRQPRLPVLAKLVAGHIVNLQLLVVGAAVLDAQHDLHFRRACEGQAVARDEQPIY